MRFIVKKPIGKTFEAVRRELSDVQAIVHHLLLNNKKDHALFYLRQTMEQLPDPPYWRANERLANLDRQAERWQLGQNLPTMHEYKDEDHPQYRIGLNRSVLSLSNPFGRRKKEAKPASELQ